MRNKILTSGICGAAAVAPAVALAAGPSANQSNVDAAQSSLADVTVRIYAARELTAAEASTRRLRAAERRKRALRRLRQQTAAPIPAALQTIAACESGGDPKAADGQFRGKYQFDSQTWSSVGGTGDPAAASSAEQDRRAAVLYQRQGTAPWPVCGRGH